MGLITNSSPFFNKLNLQSSDLVLIDALIEVASDQIEKYCNRIFSAADYAEYTNGLGWNQLFVKNPPINSLTSIQFVANTTTTVAASNFAYKANEGEIRWDENDVTDSSEYVGNFRQGYNNIIINYNGGFTSIPDTIQFICAEMVAQMFSPAESTEAIAALKLGNYYVKYKDGVDKTLFKYKSMLSMYRLQPVVLP